MCMQWRSSSKLKGKQRLVLIVNAWHAMRQVNRTGYQIAVELFDDVVC